MAEIAIDEGYDNGVEIDAGVEEERATGDGVFYEVSLDPEPDTEVRIAEITFDDNEENRSKKRRRFEFC